MPEWMQERGMFKGSYNRAYDDYVCTDKLGNLLTPRYVTLRFSQVLEKNGMRHIRFHDLRHTYATHSIAVGVDEKTLAKELGHTKPGFTLDCYAHVTEEMQKRASEVTGNALEKILGKELKPWADERTDKG